MRTSLLIILFTFSSLFAECSKQYHILGMQQELSQFFDSNGTKNSIIWSQDKRGVWNVSKPLDTLSKTDFDCTKSGYILLPIAPTLSSGEYEKQSYDLQKGWNSFLVPKEGIDIVKTFKDHNESVAFVYTYEPKTQVWAGYSPNKELMQKIFTTRILGLKSVEPMQELYIFARKDIELKIQSTLPNQHCQKLIDNAEKYDHLTDSGLDKEGVKNQDKTIFLQSRYVSHFVKGIYDDTRITMIYPKLNVSNKKLMAYGPAVPKAALKFAKDYEGKIFFMYDYKTGECYEGVFPSMLKPPMPVLKKLQ